MSKLTTLLLDKLVVETEPELATSQFMLINRDLLPVEPKRRQWTWLNFLAFWIADSLNIVCSYSPLLPLQPANFLYLEYMDDLFLYDARRFILVAGLVIRLDRILHFIFTCLPYWSHWSRLPYLLSSCLSCILWDLGKHVACYK